MGNRSAQALRRPKSKEPSSFSAACFAAGILQGEWKRRSQEVYFNSAGTWEDVCSHVSAGRPGAAVPTQPSAACFLDTPLRNIGRSHFPSVGFALFPLFSSGPEAMASQGGLQLGDEILPPHPLAGNSARRRATWASTGGPHGNRAQSMQMQRTDESRAGRQNQAPRPDTRHLFCPGPAVQQCGETAILRIQRITVRMFWIKKFCGKRGNTTYESDPRRKYRPPPAATSHSGMPKTSG
jgi:hypothetical protein